MSDLNLRLHVWRQSDAAAEGKFREYAVRISEHASFLEMLDVLNESLSQRGETPMAFDHDCREGTCGSCGFRDGDDLWVEPFRARSFPVLRDLVVNRGAFDRMPKSPSTAPRASPVAPLSQPARMPPHPSSPPPTWAT